GVRRRSRATRCERSRARMSTQWLAIDTATDVASVAIGSAEHIEAVRVIRGARQHAAQVLPVIQQVLAAARTRVGQIGGIVVGDGPGSFTGLRIGWAAAKGLVHERDLQARAVPARLGLPPVAGSLLVLAPTVGYPATGEPVYGRPAEAQVKWETSHGRPLPHSSR